MQMLSSEAFKNLYNRWEQTPEGALKESLWRQVQNHSDAFSKSRPTLSFPTARQKTMSYSDFQVLSPEIQNLVLKAGVQVIGRPKNQSAANAGANNAGAAASGGLGGFDLKQAVKQARQFTDAIKLGEEPTQEDIMSRYKVMANLPGMSTEIYDKMLKQAGDSARLNMGLAMMQAGFGAAAAAPKEGESPFSTLSRTLFQPLSAAAMQTMGAARKEKMAAQLGKLGAQRGLSTAALQAEMAAKGIKDKAVMDLVMEAFKKTGKRDNILAEPYVILGKDGKRVGQDVVRMGSKTTDLFNIRTGNKRALGADESIQKLSGHLKATGVDAPALQSGDFRLFKGEELYTIDGRVPMVRVIGKGKNRGKVVDLGTSNIIDVDGEGLDLVKVFKPSAGDARTYTGNLVVVDDKKKGLMKDGKLVQVRLGSDNNYYRVGDDDKYTMPKGYRAMSLERYDQVKSADKEVYTGRLIEVYTKGDKEGQAVTDNEGNRVELSLKGNIPYQIGKTEPYTREADTRLMAPDKWQPPAPQGMDTEKFKQAFKGFKGQIQSKVRRLGVDKNFGYSAGKFTYRDNAGKVQVFDEPTQKIFTDAIKGKFFTTLGGKIGAGTFQIGTTDTGSLVDQTIRDFFNSTPTEIIGDLLVTRGGAPPVQAPSGTVSLPSDFPVIDLSATGQKARFQKARKTMANNKVPPAVALANMRESGSDTVSSTGSGRLLDAVKVSPEIFGAETLDIKNPDAIQKRLIYENRMKHVPADDTRMSKKNMGTPINRYSVITKAVNDYNTVRDKKWNTTQNQALTINFKDLVRSIGIVDKYSRAAGAANVEGFVKGPMRSFLEKKGLSVLDPTTWFESKDAKEMRREIVALAANLEQLIGRGLLKESGDSRFSDKDVEGIKTVIANLNDTGVYNAEKLSQLRNFMMNGLRSMLNQTGSFRMDDADIAEAIKLGVDPKEVRISQPEKGHYSKYASVADRTYAVSGQKAPGATAQDLTNLKQQGVFDMFKKPSGYYEIIKTHKVQGVIQPMMTGGKFDTIEVSEDTLFSPAMKPHTDYTYRVFQKRLGR